MPPVRVGILILLILVGAVFALSSGHELYVRVTYLLLLVLGASWLWTRLSLRGMSVNYEGSRTYATVGELVTEQMTVYNDSWLAKFWIEISLLTNLPAPVTPHVTHFQPNGERTWRLQLECRRRGRFLVGPTRLAGGDPFGFFRKETVVGQQFALTVYPATVPLTRFALPPADLPGEGRYRRRTHFVTPNASSVREYVYGDSYNRIHWPTTARSGKLMVKEFELDPAAETWIVLDLDESVQAGSGLQGTEEYAVAAAASVIKHYLDANRPIGLLAYGHQLDLYRPDRGGHQMARLMEALALAQAVGTVPLADLLAGEARRFGRFSTLLIITSSTGETWVQQLQHLIQRGARAAVIMVEPTTFGAQESPLLTVGALAASGVQSMLVKQAPTIIQALQVLETSPDGGGGG
jgi:uncharacterized protein (DUF58 family)